jgi:phosphoribosyl 1,2-cyclic phosphate phosphodiesterase
MSLRFTILGTGSSGGVPRVGQVWGNCDPNNPKNRRRRCALLVDHLAGSGMRTTVLVDTPPDIREQLLETRVARVDAVLMTRHPTAVDVRRCERRGRRLESGCDGRSRDG